MSEVGSVEWQLRRELAAWRDAVGQLDDKDARHVYAAVDAILATEGKPTSTATPARTGRPITPDEVAAAKEEAIPGFVFDAFNACIAKAWRGQEAVVLQKDVVEVIERCFTKGEFDMCWLDVEPIYRKAGWSVVYNKPAYCETNEPSFTFSRGKK